MNWDFRRGQQAPAIETSTASFQLVEQEKISGRTCKNRDPGAARGGNAAPALRARERRWHC